MPQYQVVAWQTSPLVRRRRRHHYRHYRPRLHAILHPHPHPLLTVQLARLAAEEAPYLSQLASSTMAGSERRV